MLIDVFETKMLIFDNANGLGSVGRSQLLFWNFEQNDRLTEYYITLEKQIFLKVINYFENEGLEFKLSIEAGKYYEEISRLSENFNTIKSLATAYKSGNYDTAKYKNFRGFIIDYIKRPLKIHQIKAAYHLYILGNGANFSVPGSGKTSVVLTVYEKLRLEGKVNILFVVGPPSCFGPWKNEFIETLGRTPSQVILAGGNKRNRKNYYYETSANLKELYLTTYQSLLFDQEQIGHFLKQMHVKAFLVIDEAHYIKQINGNWAHSILKQAEKAAFRCVLTGTPMPRSYIDVFNLFDFLWPNLDPISHTNKLLIKHNEEIGNKNLVKNILDEHIGPLFYRVRKIDLKLSKQNFFSPEIIEMHKNERIIYDAIWKRIKDYSKDDYYKNIEFITSLGKGRIMRLRQAISYPKLLTSAIIDYDESLFDDLTDLKNIIKHYDTLEITAKLQYLTIKLKEFNKSKLKVVVWSNFVGTIALIEKHLKKEGLNCKSIFGAVPIEGNSLKDEETREKIRDQFVAKNSGLDILVANPAACAESISLHKTCHNAIYYDLNYNCAQYLQSLDRIHRVGGSEFIEANYYFLQYKNTIDIDIKDNIDTKTLKMFEVIDEDYPIYSLNVPDSDGDSEAYKRLFPNPILKDR